MAQLNFSKLKEFFNLLNTHLVVQTRNLFENIKIICKYYTTNLSFFKTDVSLLLTYLFDNPFAISKRFLLLKGEIDIYAYGETPLTSLQIIAEKCQITSKDLVLELGCGRGRTCFWLNSFIGCKVIGIELIPEFVERAERIRKKLKITGVRFLQEDFFLTDYSKATVVYLYGTCLEKYQVEKLINSLSTLPSGAKIITVSYALNDFSNTKLFETMKRFPVPFTWGTADIYMQIKK